jgi:hypothetical protein
MAEIFKQKKNGFIQKIQMSVTPPEAPPYPTTPTDSRQDDEISAAAYAEILVCFIKNIF